MSGLQLRISVIALFSHRVIRGLASFREHLPGYADPFLIATNYLYLVITQPVLNLRLLIMFLQLYWLTNMNADGSLLKEGGLGRGEKPCDPE